MDDGKKSDYLFDLYENNYETRGEMARKRGLGWVGYIMGARGGGRCYEQIELMAT